MLEVRQETQDEIALNQLRRIMILSKDIAYSNNSLSFEYHDERWTVSLINDHLVMQPGTQIFFTDIDGVYFTSSSNILYITYTRDNKSYEKALSNIK